MKNIKKFLQVLFVAIVLLASMGGVARAQETPVPDPVSVHLNIIADSGPIYDEDLTISACDNDNEEATEDLRVTAYCAVLQSGHDSIWSWFGSDAFLDSIDSTINNDGNNGIYWGWFANLGLGQTALNKYTLEEGDSILLEYNIAPMKIAVSSETPAIGDTVTITIEQSDYNSLYTDTWSPAAGGKLVVGSDIFDLDANGTYSIVVSDSASFTVKGQKEGFVDTADITITPDSPGPTSSSSGSSKKNKPKEEVLGAVTKASFDLNKAFTFLMAQQADNGAFGEDIYTDWAAIAIASMETQSQTIQPILGLVKNLSANKPAGTLLTDYERHAMALMAFGLDPYNTNGENYIQKIVSAFDGKQFGDINEDNDDIFALIILEHAGYGTEEKMLKESISFVLGRQKENGSWDESIDMTGAALQALSIFKEDDQVKPALIKAKEFLKTTQKDNGSWNNDVSSTAWVIGGIMSLGEKPADWTRKETSPLDYLSTIQDTDGGVKDELIKNKIWKTAYVVSALSGKTWNQVLKKFEKKEPPQTQVTIEAPKPIAQKPVQKSAQKPKIAAPKIEIAADPNTVSAISTPVSLPQPLEIQPTPQLEEKGWFTKLLENIFGF